MKKDKLQAQASVDWQPGSTVTGIYIHTDRSQGMIILQLLKGARGWMSIYEMSDELIGRLIPGLPISGTVDRVEVDGNGRTTVILQGEFFRQLC